MDCLKTNPKLNFNLDFYELKKISLLEFLEEYDSRQHLSSSSSFNLLILEGLPLTYALTG